MAKIKKMYAKRAYVHWMVGTGIEDECAREGMDQLENYSTHIKEHKQSMLHGELHEEPEQSDNDSY
jgi:hypothetical protein